MKPIIILFLATMILFVISGCNTHYDNEYQIYSMILDQLVELHNISKPKSKFLLKIVDHTSLETLGSKSITNNYVYGYIIHGVHENTLSSFKQKNLTPLKLTKCNFKVGVNTRFVNDKYVHDLHNHKRLIEFAKSDSLLIALSRIGLNSNNTQALVFLQQYPAIEYQFLLEWRGGKWTIINYTQTLKEL